MSWLRSMLALFVVLGVTLAPIRGAARVTMSEGSGLPRSELWARVLDRFHESGGLDYASLKRSREDLDEYLVALQSADLSGAAKEERLAFWINAYNAVVTSFVLDLYPGIESVKEVDGFFDKRTFPVAGEQLTLDEIESQGLDLGDPRIHFAVVCASSSCPDLREEPFVAARLDEQLEEQTRSFLADPVKGLLFDETANEVWLSSIFKWYAGDFTGGSTAVAFVMRGKVLAWVLEHLSPELADRINRMDPSVRYLDYDWSLNDRSAS